jgi:hypothetical protein
MVLMEILADKMHGSAWKSTFKAIDALVEKSTQCNQPHPSKTYRFCRSGGKDDGWRGLPGGVQI